MFFVVLFFIAALLMGIAGIAIAVTFHDKREGGLAVFGGFLCIIAIIIMAKVVRTEVFDPIKIRGEL